MHQKNKNSQVLYLKYCVLPAL